jgi:hypothetical protein
VIKQLIQKMLREWMRVALKSKPVLNDDIGTNGAEGRP